MSILETISKPERDNYMITIVGEPGVGKTSLAATFPNPIFIRTEDGFTTFKGKEIPDAFPVAKKYDDVIEQLTVLGTDKHEYKTVVIDSITELNCMIETEIVKLDLKATSINNALGGWGAGPATGSEKNKKIRRICDKLCSKINMNVIFIAHAAIEKITPPEDDPYSRYGIDINKASVGHYTFNVDIVAFVKQRVFVNDNKNQASTDGSVMITCHNTPSHISKNRFDIIKDFQFIRGENPFKQFKQFKNF